MSKCCQHCAQEEATITAERDALRASLAEARAWTAASVDDELRVPQYDRELRLAGEALESWQRVAAQLYATRNLSRRELRRIAAENSYANLAKSYNLEII